MVGTATANTSNHTHLFHFKLTLGPIADIFVVTLSAIYMMSLLATLLCGVRFCRSRKVGTGWGGWVHLQGEKSMNVSGLGCRKVLVQIGKAISVFKSSVSLCKASISSI